MISLRKLLRMLLRKLLRPLLRKLLRPPLRRLAMRNLLLKSPLRSFLRLVRTTKVM